MMGHNLRTHFGRFGIGLKNHHGFGMMNNTTLMRIFGLTVPATSVTDTNFTVSGQAQYLFGRTVKIYAKKSTQTWKKKVLIGTASVQNNGTWTTTTAQLPSIDFTAGETINVRAEYGSVTSSVENMTVASGTLLLQIPSVDCDFTPKQKKIVPGTTKAIVAGSVAYTGGSPTIGGEALDSGLSEVVVCYDLDTQAVQWIGQPKSSVGATSQGMSLFSNQLHVDADNAYLAWTFNEVTERVYLKKWAISDGATTNALELNIEANNSNVNACAICGDSTYIYGVSSNVKLYGFKVVKSTFLKDSDKNDLLATGQTGTGGNSIALSVEGSTLYYATQITKADGNFVSKNSCTTAFASVTEIERYITYDGTTAWRSSLFGSSPLNRTMAIQGIDDAGGGYAELWRILSDENSTENDTTKLILSDANGLLFNCYTAGNVAKINQSTLAETWNVDYTVSYDVVKFVGVVYDGTSYWLVGETDGDFDGNNPTNTKSCLIFAKLDADDGSI